MTYVATRLLAVFRFATHSHQPIHVTGSSDQPTTRPRSCLRLRDLFHQFQFQSQSGCDGL
jgi:hypothetical protein